MLRPIPAIAQVLLMVLVHVMLVAGDLRKSSTIPLDHKGAPKIATIATVKKAGLKSQKIVSSMLAYSRMSEHHQRYSTSPHHLPLPRKTMQDFDTASGANKININGSEGQHNSCNISSTLHDSILLRKEVPSWRKELAIQLMKENNSSKPASGKLQISHKNMGNKSSFQHSLRTLLAQANFHPAPRSPVKKQVLKSAFHARRDIASRLLKIVIENSLHSKKSVPDTEFKDGLPQASFKAKIPAKGQAANLDMPAAAGCGIQSQPRAFIPFFEPPVPPKEILPNRESTASTSVLATTAGTTSVDTNSNALPTVQASSTERIPSVSIHQVMVTGSIRKAPAGLIPARMRPQAVVQDEKNRTDAKTSQVKLDYLKAVARQFMPKQQPSQNNTSQAPLLDFSYTNSTHPPSKLVLTGMNQDGSSKSGEVHSSVKKFLKETLRSEGLNMAITQLDLQTINKNQTRPIPASESFLPNTTKISTIIDETLAATKMQPEDNSGAALFPYLGLQHSQNSAKSGLDSQMPRRPGQIIPTTKPPQIGLQNKFLQAVTTRQESRNRITSNSEEGFGELRAAISKFLKQQAVDTTTLKTIHHGFNTSTVQGMTMFPAAVRKPAGPQIETKDIHNHQRTTGINANKYQANLGHALWQPTPNFVSTINQQALMLTNAAAKTRLLNSPIRDDFYYFSGGEIPVARLQQPAIATVTTSRGNSDQAQLLHDYKQMITSLNTHKEWPGQSSSLDILPNATLTSIPVGHHGETRESVGTSNFGSFTSANDNFFNNFHKAVPKLGMRQMRFRPKPLLDTTVMPVAFRTVKEQVFQTVHSNDNEKIIHPDAKGFATLGKLDPVLIGKSMIANSLQSSSHLESATSISNRHANNGNAAGNVAIEGQSALAKDDSKMNFNLGFSAGSQMMPLAKMKLDPNGKLLMQLSSGELYATDMAITDSLKQTMVSDSLALDGIIAISSSTPAAMLDRDDFDYHDIQLPPLTLPRMASTLAAINHNKIQKGDSMPAHPSSMVRQTSESTEVGSENGFFKVSMPGQEAADGFRQDMQTFFGLSENEPVSDYMCRFKVRDNFREAIENNQIQRGVPKRNVERSL